MKLMARNQEVEDKEGAAVGVGKYYHSTRGKREFRACWAQGECYKYRSCYRDQGL